MKKSIEVKKDRVTSVNYKDLMCKNRLFFDLMEHSPDVIYFKDNKARIVMVNQAHAKGLGLKPEEVVGKTDFDFFPKERAQIMFKDDMRVMKTARPIIDKIERATRTDGVDNYVSTTKIPRYDEKGNVIGLVGITRDITKRMQWERLNKEKVFIEKKLEALEDSNRLKSEFISIVSHELRTPLAIIKDAVMLIFDQLAGPINEQQRQIIIKAQNNIDRLNKIIEELLEISRIESDRLKLRYSLVNLNDLLEDSSGFFKKLAQEKGISLEYKLPRKQVNIFLDFERVNQVISNLVNNAIKFTEEGGRIEIELRILESKVRISVMDTGIGIAKQDLPKLFRKFTQLSHISSAERKGVGLGLSIVKELVEKQGGEVWAESKLGVGSKFYFTLPRFYTTSVLGKDVKDRVNSLLNKGIELYLINILIVNYGEFRKKFKVGPTKLFNDLVAIINGALKDSRGHKEERPQLAFSDMHHGEYSIIYPVASSKEANEICKLLKEEMQTYFIKNKAEDIFINVGILPYSAKGQLQLTQQLLSNLYIKKIYIGSEIRRFKRVPYKANIEVILAKDRKELSQTIDISLGGVCFISPVALKTDSCIQIKLKLPREKRPILLKAEVAWIKNIIEEGQKGKVNKYKVGLEFSGLKQEDKKILAKFVKSAD